MTAQGTWERSNVEKTHSLNEHLAKVFHPILQKINSKKKKKKKKKKKHLYNFLRTHANLNH
jgi:hypothetical protein